jgi:hypothetical protein
MTFLLRFIANIFYSLFVTQTKKIKKLSHRADVLTLFAGHPEKALHITDPRHQQAARKKNKTGALRVTPLKKDTFTKYKKELKKEGASFNQIKIPHLLTNEIKLAFSRKHTTGIEGRK